MAGQQSQEEGQHGCACREVTKTASRVDDVGNHIGAANEQEGNVDTHNYKVYSWKCPKIKIMQTQGTEVDKHSCTSYL